MQNTNITLNPQEILDAAIEFGMNYKIVSQIAETGALIGAYEIAPTQLIYNALVKSIDNLKFILHDIAGCSRNINEEIWDDQKAIMASLTMISKDINTHFTRGVIRQALHTADEKSTKSYQQRRDSKVNK